MNDSKALADRANLAMGPGLDSGHALEDGVADVGGQGVQSLEQTADRLDKLDGTGTCDRRTRAQDDHEPLGGRHQQGADGTAINLLDDDEAQDNRKTVERTLDVRGHALNKRGRLGGNLGRDGRHGCRARRIHAARGHLDGHGGGSSYRAGAESVPHGATKTAGHLTHHHRTRAWLGGKAAWNHSHL